MTTMRRAIGCLMAVVLAGFGLAAPAVATPPGTAVAAAGILGPLYTQGPGSGWVNLGGQIVGAPAMVVAGGMTHYIATGTNRVLYHRTDTTGWTRMAAPEVWCVHVSAVAIAGTITVACVGANSALYSLQFPASARYPFLQVADLTRIGGRIYGSASVVDDAGTPRFFVVGGTYPDGGTGSNTYTTTGSGWTRWNTYCLGAVGASYTDTLKVVACQQDFDFVRIETGSATGEWTARSVPGRTAFAPAIVPTGDGSTAQLFLVGTNYVPYSRAIAYADAGTGWTSLGGLVNWGITAAKV